MSCPNLISVFKQLVMKPFVVVIVFGKNVAMQAQFSCGIPLITSPLAPVWILVVATR